MAPAAGFVTTFPDGGKKENPIQSTRMFLTISIDDPPRIALLDEDAINGKMVLPAPFYHSWLRGAAGIIGVRFSSWMINQGLLSKKEKEVVAGWNKSKADHEVYFSPSHDYDEEKSNDEAVKHTSIIKLDKLTHAVAFPLFGESTSKSEMLALGANIAAWA